MRLPVDFVLCCFAIGAALCSGGCANSSGPQLIQVSAADYSKAFDAAVDAARDAHMPSALRDRRNGVIETESAIAASIIEPWRTDNASFDQAVENTIAFQRRRARFEFAPAGGDSQPTAEASTIDNNDASPKQSDLDLTGHKGELKLRVWVYVERANTPGFRRAAWSRRTASRTLMTPLENQDVPATIWTPVARDRAYERRLLAAVERQLRAPVAAER